MTALAWFMGGIFLGLLVMAVVQFIDLLFTPFTVAMNALFSVEEAKRRRAAQDLQRYSDAMGAVKRGQERKP